MGNWFCHKLRGLIPTKVASLPTTVVLGLVVPSAVAPLPSVPEGLVFDQHLQVGHTIIASSVVAPPLLPL